MYNICNYGYLGRRWSVFRELSIITKKNVFSRIVRNSPVTDHLLPMMNGPSSPYDRGRHGRTAGFLLVLPVLLLMCSLMQ